MEIGDGGRRGGGSYRSQEDALLLIFRELPHSHTPQTRPEL